MTSDQWKALNEYLKAHSRWYPFDQAPTNECLTMGVLRELVENFEDSLATGDVELRDEP